MVKLDDGGGGCRASFNGSACVPICSLGQNPLTCADPLPPPKAGPAPGLKKLVQQNAGRIEGWVNTANVVLIVGAGACAAGSVFTLGGAGAACAAIYFGATASSVASTAFAAKRVATGRSNAADLVGLVIQGNAAGCALLTGAARVGCRVSAGVAEGLWAPAVWIAGKKQQADGRKVPSTRGARR